MPTVFPEPMRTGARGSLLLNGWNMKYASVSARFALWQELVCTDGGMFYVYKLQKCGDDHANY